MRHIQRWEMFRFGLGGGNLREEKTTWKSYATWKDNIKVDFLDGRCGPWAGLIWLKIGTVVRLL